MPNISLECKGCPGEIKTVCSEHMERGGMLSALPCQSDNPTTIEALRALRAVTKRILRAEVGKLYRTNRH